VLGHRHAAAGHHEGGGGGDVEGLQAVAARAAGIHDRRAGGLDAAGVAPHGLAAPASSSKRFALGGQGGHHGADLGFGGLTGQHRVHHLGHLRFGQVAALDDALQIFFEHGANSPFDRR
jgi:hypothetical protein